jgi:hypothetical protein
MSRCPDERVSTRPGEGVPRPSTWLLEGAAVIQPDNLAACQATCKPTEGKPKGYLRPLERGTATALGWLVSHEARPPLGTFFAPLGEGKRAQRQARCP